MRSSVHPSHKLASQIEMDHRIIVGVRVQAYKDRSLYVFIIHKKNKDISEMRSIIIVNKLS